MECYVSSSMVAGLYNPLDATASSTAAGGEVMGKFTFVIEFEDGKEPLLVYREAAKKA